MHLLGYTPPPGGIMEKGGGKKFFVVDTTVPRGGEQKSHHTHTTRTLINMDKVCEQQYKRNRKRRRSWGRGERWLERKRQDALVVCCYFRFA